MVAKVSQGSAKSKASKSKAVKSSAKSVTGRAGVVSTGAVFRRVGAALDLAAAERAIEREKSAATPEEKAATRAEQEASEAGVDPAFVWVVASDRSAAQLRPGLGVADYEVHCKTGVVVAVDGEDVIYRNVDGEEFRAPIELVNVPKAGSLGDVSGAVVEGNPIAAIRRMVKPGMRFSVWRDECSFDGGEVVGVCSTGVFLRFDDGEVQGFGWNENMAMDLDDEVVKRFEQAEGVAAIAEKVLGIRQSLAGVVGNERAEELDKLLDTFGARLAALDTPTTKEA